MLTKKNSFIEKSIDLVNFKERTEYELRYLRSYVVDISEAISEKGDALEVSIGTLIDPPICGVLDPLKTVFFVLKQSDYFLLCAPRPV